MSKNEEIPLIDDEVIGNLRRLEDFEPSLLKKLIAIFLEETPSRVDRLRELGQSEDAEALAREAHRLKGSCLHIGAARMGQICAEIEKWARQGDLRAAQPLIAELDGSTEDSYRQLQAECEEGS